MAGFTKLFSTIITSSVWSEDDHTRLMWITMLATADADGYVAGTVPGMAALARMSICEADAAIAKLTSPDRYSRTPDHDGRRLLPTEGGWLISNYALYRDKRDPERRRQQNRDAKRRQREREKQPTDPPDHISGKPDPDAGYGQSNVSQQSAEHADNHDSQPKSEVRGQMTDIEVDCARGNSTSDFDQPQHRCYGILLRVLNVDETTEQGEKDVTTLANFVAWLNGQIAERHLSSKDAYNRAIELAKDSIHGEKPVAVFNKKIRDAFHYVSPTARRRAQLRRKR